METPSRAIPGQTCMVSTGHHLSTLAGLEVLRQGGNAVDAAVAAGAVSSVVLPHACGLGGDAFAIGYAAIPGHVWTLNASGKPPQLASLSLFARGIPNDEVVSATVPEVVDGWSELLSRYGTRSFQQLFVPAITHAEEGFIVDEKLSRLVVENELKLRKHPYSKRIFFDNGSPIRAGQILRQLDLAHTLKLVASRGSAEFYRGETAKKVCSYVESVGGHLREQDLANHRSELGQNAIRTTYCGCEILVPPPNSMAILLLVQLSLLANVELDELRHNSAEYIGRLVDAKRLAFENVLPLLGDPDSTPLDISGMLSEDFVRDLLRKQRRAVQTERPEISDTTCIVVVDGEGNTVSLLQSLFFHFGCGAIAGSAGILLSNRMSGFSVDPGHPNVVQGAKRPAHTLSPALVLRGSKPLLVLGTPGAYAQTQTLCQILNNLLVFHMEIQQALEAPRWLDGLDNVLVIEDRISRDVIDALVGRGYNVRLGGPWDPRTGNPQAVLIETESDERVLYGAADPRRHGFALGW